MCTYVRIYLYQVNYKKLDQKIYTYFILVRNVDTKTIKTSKKIQKTKKHSLFTMYKYPYIVKYWKKEKTRAINRNSTLQKKMGRVILSGHHGEPVYNCTKDNRVKLTKQNLW